MAGPVLEDTSKLVFNLYKGHHPLGNFVTATLETSKVILMNLIMTMIFIKIPLKFQVLLQQSCLVDGGLKQLNYIYSCMHGLLVKYDSYNQFHHTSETFAINVKHLFSHLQVHPFRHKYKCLT